MHQVKYQILVTKIIIVYKLVVYLYCPFLCKKICLSAKLFYIAIIFTYHFFLIQPILCTMLGIFAYKMNANNFEIIFVSKYSTFSIESENSNRTSLCPALRICLCTCSNGARTLTCLPHSRSRTLGENLRIMVSSANC